MLDCVPKTDVGADGWAPKRPLVGVVEAVPKGLVVAGVAPKALAVPKAPAGAKDGAFLPLR